MKLNFNNNKVPKIYIRDNKEYYLDPIRKKLILVTPEETVRQKIIQTLLKNKFPENRIAIEEHLSHYGIKSKLRADIVIKEYIEKDNVVEPVAIIECKSPNITIDTKAFEQVSKYADLLNADYVALTNGTDCFYFHYNSEKKYEAISEFPSYNNLLDNNYKLLEVKEPPKRIEFDKLKTDGIPAYINNEIGENTPVELQAAMVNFCECIYDESHQIPIKQCEIFKVIKDLGVRISSYGDASGGLFSGFYRAFLIEYQDNTEIVSIGISTYCTWAKQDIHKTTINIAIDNENESHHSLQLVVDDNVKVINNTLKFYHHGRIAVGNIGSGKIDELRNFVYQKYPKIIFRKQFYFGELTNDRLWNISDADMIELIESLISYALIRDDYRHYLKSKKNK